MLKRKHSLDLPIFDVFNYDPLRVPSKTWNKLIKKVREVDLLTCPQSGTVTKSINTLIGYSGFSAGDFSRDWHLDTEAIYSYSDQNVLSFGAGYSHDEFGNFEFGGFFPAGNTLL